jgi:protein TonB
MQQKPQMPPLSEKAGKIKPAQVRVDVAPHRLHTGFLWVLSIGLALLLNLSLFGFMPRLIGRVPGHMEPRTVAWPVNIVHLRPKKPPPAKERKPPPREKRAPAIRKQTVRPAAPRPSYAPKPLSVDLRPHLPPLPRGLPDLALQTVPLAPVAAPTSTGPRPSKGVYAEGELDGPLMPISRVPPAYPLAARHKRIEGWVKVKFLVTRRGTVERVTITEAHPAGVFDKAVLRAVSSWRFKPGAVEGRNVDTWAQSTLEFKLQ